jgi:glycerate 2-kinase
MKIILAPDSFKEALSAREVCAAITRGLRRVLPDAVIESVPMADGGEGTVDALLAATGGTLRHTTVRGPLGEPVLADWGLLEQQGQAPTSVAPASGLQTGVAPASGPQTRVTPASRRCAVIEMAAASGLALIPPDRRDTMRASTYGTGELIRAALHAGATRIIVGIGGSATTDGGTGAAQAAGVRFLDTAGRELPTGLAGGQLNLVRAIDISQRDPRIRDAQIAAACDVTARLCGPDNCAAVYGPQKGASPEQVKILEANLARLADVIDRDLGKDLRHVPGGGAAGGLGAGLVAFFDATLERGVELAMSAARLAERVAGADIVITGEGRLDHQSAMGKVISGVARTARESGVRVYALVGSLGPRYDEALPMLDGHRCITPTGTPLPEALAATAENLERAAEALARDLLTGRT